jgi:uncharacterized protein YecE (DUF72 family)
MKTGDLAMSTEEHIMTTDQLKELVRFVVFETVTEIRRQEHEQIEAVKEQEEQEEWMEEAMRTLRTRAAFLTVQLKKLFKVDVQVIDNADSVEMFILSDDLSNGNSIRLELDSLRARKNGLNRSWSYENRNEYEESVRSAVRWLSAGVSD